jgi:hypothetical protein
MICYEYLREDRISMVFLIGSYSVAYVIDGELRPHREDCRFLETSEYWRKVPIPEEYKAYLL